MFMFPLGNVSYPKDRVYKYFVNVYTFSKVSNIYWVVYICADACQYTDDEFNMKKLLFLNVIISLDIN